MKLIRLGNLGGLVFFDANEKVLKPGDYVIFPGLFGMSDSGVIQNVRILGPAEGQDHLLENQPEGSKAVKVEFSFSDSTMELGETPGTAKMLEDVPDLEERLLEPSDSSFTVTGVQIGNKVSCFCYVMDKPSPPDDPTTKADWWKK